MTEPLSPRAQQLRQHRRIFEYALEHGLTLHAAKRALARADRAAADEAARVVRQCGRAAEEPASLPGAAWDRRGPAPENAPWMMRD